MQFYGFAQAAVIVIHVASLSARLAHAERNGLGKSRLSMFAVDPLPTFAKISVLQLGSRDIADQLFLIVA
jgi:hypothetical protein